MTALAVGDEQPTLAWAHVPEPQTEDLATAQAAEQHRFHHRSVPRRAQCRDEDIDLVGVDHAGKRARCPDQRDAADRALARSPHRQAARDRVVRHGRVPTDDQILIKSGDRRQPTLDRARRQSGLAVLDAHDLGPEPRFTLGLDKRQHIRCDDLAGFLLDH